MGKRTEKIEVYDVKARGFRVVDLELSGPDLVLEALDRGCLNTEILANAIYGTVGNKCLLEARVIVKDRNGKRRRQAVIA